MQRNSHKTTTEVVQLPRFKTLPEIIVRTGSIYEVEVVLIIPNDDS